MTYDEVKEVCAEYATGVAGPVRLAALIAALNERTKYVGGVAVIKRERGAGGDVPSCETPEIDHASVAHQRGVRIAELEESLARAEMSLSRLHKGRLMP